MSATDLPTAHDIGRALWLEDRRKGIGGTDAAAILGLSPYATALDVWLQKRDEAAPKPQSEAMWWGSALEDIVARRYMEKTGRKVWNPEGLFAHREHPELVGTPDRLVIGQARGLEVKTASQWADGWGEPGTDEIPHAYIVQCHHYMAITGFPVWDVAVLIGGSDFRVYTLNRDESFEASLVEQLLAWWQRHVVEGERPPITGADSAREWLHRRFPRDTKPLIPADPVAEAFAASLLMARQTMRDAEAVRDESENNLKAIIGEAAGIQGDGWKVSWKATKDRERVDWKKVSENLVQRYHLAASDLALAMLQATATEPGVRRFLFTPAKPEKGQS